MQVAVGRLSVVHDPGNMMEHRDMDEKLKAKYFLSINLAAAVVHDFVRDDFQYRRIHYLDHCRGAFFNKLATDSVNGELRDLGPRLGNYLRQIVEFETFHTDQRPYPFAPVPTDDQATASGGPATAS